MADTPDRNVDLSQFSPMIDATVVRRYRANYNLDDEIGETEVKRHWEVESELTRRLLSSTKGTRWEIFQECYTELYSRLPWLNKNEEAPAGAFRPWLKLIPKKSRIFEVSSGKGQLLKYLVSHGHDCVATEITEERGKKHADETSRLRWHVTDGVNLARFEAPSSYDVVISTQVVEHFHPDDMSDHLRNVREILRPGGRYIFDTPHVGAGPSDLSKVYGFERAVCMHLKEYDFLELRQLLSEAGFRCIKAVLFQRRPISVGPIVSEQFFKYCCTWDRMVRTMRLSPRRERLFRRVLRLVFLCLPTFGWLRKDRSQVPLAQPKPPLPVQNESRMNRGPLGSGVAGIYFGKIQEVLNLNGRSERI